MTISEKIFAMHDLNHKGFVAPGDITLETQSARSSRRLQKQTYGPRHLRGKYPVNMDTNV
jgi:hypothetical protein